MDAGPLSVVAIVAIYLMVGNKKRNGDSREQIEARAIREANVASDIKKIAENAAAIADGILETHKRVMELQGEHKLTAQSIGELRNTMSRIETRG